MSKLNELRALLVDWDSEESGWEPDHVRYCFTAMDALPDLLAVVDAAEGEAESISDCFSRLATGDLEGDEFLNAVRASGVRLAAAVARVTGGQT